MSDTFWIAFFGFMATCATIFSRWLAWREERVAKGRSDSIHSIVNQQRTDMLDKIDHLKSVIADGKSKKDGTPVAQPQVSPSGDKP